MFKQQMKAYKKKAKQVNNTPYLPLDGRVWLMNTKNPGEPISGKVVSVRLKGKREIIEKMECPDCGEEMEWNPRWEAFECKNHDSPKFWEIIKIK
jgi:hypothetical protein